MDKNMELLLFNIAMVENTRVISKIICQMVKESFIILMGLYSKVIGLMVKNMVKELKFIQMVNNIQENG